MSTPAEKAKELVDKYANLLSEEMPAKRHIEEFKACAIICIDEILDQANKILLPRKFWEDVKAAIQKL